MNENETPAPGAGEEVAAVQAVEDQPQADEQQAAEAPGDEQSEEAKSKSRERRERRKAEIERARANEAEALERARQLEREVEKLRAAAKTLPKPQPSDYPDPATYQAALTAYTATQMLDERQTRTLQSEAEALHAQAIAAQNAQQQVVAQNWETQAAEARARYADFDSVAMRPDLPITPQMAEIIKASDNAADVAYYLGKNPDLVSKIARLPPLQAAVALGRIEAQVSAPQAKPIVTQAPAPITPVRPKATPPRDPAKMTPAEYDKWRASGGTFSL